MGGIKADDLTRLRKELERRGYNPSKMSMDPSVRNPLDERGFPKRFREDPLQYIFETKNKSPGAMR